MNTVERESLVREAKMQTGALKTIGQWRNSALVISTLGAAALYAGMSGAEHRLFLGIPGGLLMAVGLAAALILNLGLKNGRRNVEYMLNLLDKEERL